ncbi:MAG: TonB-dependent receptor [Acidobacteriaceae bacterium]|nr:TonB-dependent receptor [Acidobacteriaceae bacterium]
MKLIRFTCVSLLLVLFAAALPLIAQLTTGNITGSVFDQSGATVPSATVIATNNATGVPSTTTSTSTGVYRLENLPPGTYTMSVDAPGFTKTEVKGVIVSINETVTTNLKLAVGQTSTTVEVTEAPAAIDTTTAQIQSTYDAKQLTDLPTASTGSGVINASLLAPGVTLSGNVGAGTGPSVGGQRPRNNNFTIEGIDNNSASVTGPLVMIPNDAVAEFTVLQNQFSPDFGRSSGGQFNQVVKSGTNQFHGELYEYFQNRNLNAADNLSAVSGTPLHPRYDNNRFGGNIGGPILRNKLFFFADYEYNPIGQAGTAGLLYAPTSAGYSLLSGMPGVSQTNLGVLQKYLGSASAPLSDPTLFPTVGGTAIPIGQVPVVTPNYQNAEAGVASIDYNPSEKDAVRGRFVLNRTSFIDTAASLPVFFTLVPNNNYLVTFEEYHTFSPTLINEFRLGYNRNSNTYPVGSQTFPGMNVFPNIQINDLNVQLGPDPNAPQFGYQNTYQLTDSVTWTKSAQTIKAGFDGERLISPQSFTQRVRGDYQWTTLAGYLADTTPDYLAERSQGNPIYWGNRWLFGWYANDVWKVRPDLTLNLGVRYEYQTVPAGENLQSLNAAASVPGLIEFNTPTAQTNAIMPRIGVAYSPGGSGKTAIRAGFGTNYDVLFDNFGLLTLPPQLSTTVDVTGTAGSNFLANGGIPATGPSATLTPAEARASTSGFVPNQKRPESIQWNFGIQQEFGQNWVFNTQYVGDRGVFLPVQVQLDRQPIVNATNALPVFFAMPSQATINSLTNTLSPLMASYQAATPGYIVPAYAAAGFVNPITAYMPIGNSSYQAWQNQLTRRLSKGLQVNIAYTWSHTIDDSTAEVFSTYLTPRRPMDSQNLRQDRSSSALDHRNRATMELLYDLPFFQHSTSNWFLKNIVGNWEIAPIYTYQTGTLYTVQSGADANLNGDSAPDRAFVNPTGNPSVGTGTTAILNSAGQTVGYVANNPSARYVAAPLGTLPNGGRNTAHLNPIDDIDVSAMKRIHITERAQLEFSARIINVLNHPQYVAGFLSDVGVVPSGTLTSPQVRTFTEPGSPLFNNPSAVFSSNPRSMQLALKLVF